MKQLNPSMIPEIRSASHPHPVDEVRALSAQEIMERAGVTNMLKGRILRLKLFIHTYAPEKQANAQTRKHS
jgi:hypothetical protein